MRACAKPKHTSNPNAPKPPSILTSTQAARLIREASDPSASHNCWAWRAGGAARASDDGEPGGTAGRPILGAIDGDGLDGVAVLVTRWFGGVKLGAGGLARAYGGAARDCLRAAPKAFVKRRARLRAAAPFAALGAVYAAMARAGAEPAPGGERYDEAGGDLVVVEFDVDADAAAAAAAAVADATSGRVVAEVVAAAADAADADAEEEGAAAAAGGGSRGEGAAG